MSEKKVPQVYVMVWPVKDAYRILQVGGGGNGSNFARFLARYTHATGAAGLGFYGIMDGDRVEEKNLINQDFTTRDLGENKAVVLAQRYSRAYGIEVQAIPEYLSHRDSLEGIAPDIIVGAVDNNATRRIISEYYRDTPGIFWVDMGNLEENGQVVIGYNTSAAFSGEEPGEFRLPCIMEVKRDFLDRSRDEQPHPGRLSCAELARSSPQNFLTNITAAAIAANYVYQILSHRALTSFAVEFSIWNGFKVLSNTEAHLQGYIFPDDSVT